MEDYLFPFEDDEDNEVVFDQPYFYPKIPDGGKYDDMDFYNFPNGAFITSDGYFFNNLGFDRYGGRLDDESEYFRVNPKEIVNKQQVEPPPHCEPSGQRGDPFDADNVFKGIDDGFVGEEDFGDEEIFGGRRAAPKYYKKKGDPEGAPIYPKKPAYDQAREATKVHTKQETKQKAPMKKDPKKGPIVIGAATNKQKSDAVKKIEQKTQKAVQQSKPKVEQRPKEQPRTEEKTKTATEEEAPQKKEEVKEKKEVKGEQSKKKKEQQTKEAPKEERKAEQSAAKEPVKEEKPKVEEHDKRQEGGKYYQGGRGKDYSRGQKGFYQGGRDYYYQEGKGNYQDYGGRGYHGGRGGYYDSGKPRYAEQETKKPQGVTQKKRVEAKVIQEEKASDSAWDF